MEVSAAPSAVPSVRGVAASSAPATGESNPPTELPGERSSEAIVPASELRVRATGEPRPPLGPLGDPTVALAAWMGVAAARTADTAAWLAALPAVWPPPGPFGGPAGALATGVTVA